MMSVSAVFQLSSPTAIDVLLTVSEVNLVAGFVAVFLSVTGRVTLFASDEEVC